MKGSSNTKLYRLTPLAQADLEEIWLYTYRTWSLEQAETYIGSLIAALDDLLIGKRIGQQTDIRDGYWKCRVAMHVIYYQYSAEYLDVIRILHCQMDIQLQLGD